MRPMLTTQLRWLVQQSYWCFVSAKQCNKPGVGFTAHEPCMASTDKFEFVCPPWSSQSKVQRFGPPPQLIKKNGFLFLKLFEEKWLYPL